MRTSIMTLVATALATAAASLPAQSPIEKPRQFKVAGIDPALPSVPQTGKNADAIRAHLKRIKLPPGFAIDLYAVVPEARHMAVAPSTNVLFVGTRRTTVWAVAQRGGSDVAPEVRSFAPSLHFSDPNGVCWTPDGSLIVAERNRVLNLRGAESFQERPDVVVIEVVPQGQLIPPAEESPNHGARTCRGGPDGKLYITLGQPFNVPPLEKLDLYRQWGIGGIVRLDPFDGSRREVFAVGIRNSVGLDFNPKDGSLWFTDNQTDGLGDEVPPGELNRATKPGQDFGYPYWNGHFKVAGSSAAPDLKNLPEPKDAVFPQVEYPAHQAQLGMTFYNGTMFPARYRGGIFAAAHGSWNRSKPTGALVDFTSLEADGTAGKTEVFAEGWLDDDTGAYRGRPVDVAVMKDGSLLVSDDFAGAIYRITYHAP